MQIEIASLFRQTNVQRFMNYVMQQLNSSKGTQQMKFILYRLVIIATKGKKKMFAVISKLPLFLVKCSLKAQILATQQKDSPKLFIWNHLFA